MTIQVITHSMSFYVIDIYNELGLNYDINFEEIKNLLDVYIKIYFPKIRMDDFKNIMDFLNTATDDSKKIIERNKLKIIYDSINTELILENEIMRNIEVVKKKIPKNTQKFSKRILSHNQ